MRSSRHHRQAVRQTGRISRAHLQMQTVYYRNDDMPSTSREMCSVYDICCTRQIAQSRVPSVSRFSTTTSGYTRKLPSHSSTEATEITTTQQYSSLVSKYHITSSELSPTSKLFLELPGLGQYTLSSTYRHEPLYRPTCAGTPIIQPEHFVV